MTEYLEGTLPDPVRARFDAHLAECPYCQTYLEQMRQTIAVLGRLSEDTIDPNIREESLRRFRVWKQRG